MLVSKAPQLLGRASLENSEWQQAATSFQSGLRYRGWSLSEGSGATQTPDYALCLLGTARAQSHFDKAAATRSYQQLLDIWKNADPDFVPAQEANELGTCGQPRSGPVAASAGCHSGREW